MANENILTKAVIRNFNQIINDYGVDGVIAASVDTISEVNKFADF